MAAPPFSLQRIDHVLLLVEGMERALAFYEGVLGCRLLSRMPRFAMAELEAGASGVALVDITVPEGQWARPEAAGGRNQDHFCLLLGPHSEAALRAHLAAHGVEIVEEGQHGGPGEDSLSLYVRDPSGNTVELKSPSRIP